MFNFFEVNTKYISLSVLKTSEFLQVCRVEFEYKLQKAGRHLKL